MLKTIMFRKSKRTGYQICFILLYLYIYMYLIWVFLCVKVETLRPSQQFFSHVGTEPPLPGYYQYFLGGKCILLK